nr:PREDICTED: prolyl 3-hydroxylase 1-like [Latimeria chalumnae]|eukprot:XP_006013743.1 PREDICTED: prolyl 3-hydroxylase 1-like [Latimeria chalumnae]
MVRCFPWFWASTLLLALFCLPRSAQELKLTLSLPLEPYDLLFDNGVEAYNKGDWPSVILNMEKALHTKAALRRARAQCRFHCANLTGFGEPLAGFGLPVPGWGVVQDLVFFDKVLKRAECLKQCEVEKMGPASLHQVGEEVELEFKKRNPYNYLQVAYFKI